MSKILNMLMAFVMSFGISGSNVNPSDIPENSNFEVHFIDVGQADSALIECDGETMMIDGGNVAYRPAFRGRGFPGHALWFPALPPAFAGSETR